MEPIVVVGLGNPGSEYDGTRHNVGFEVVDELIQRFNVRLRAGRGEYMIASYPVGDKALILVKPLTYMNNSGTAVAELLTMYGTSLSGLIVVADDLALPLGTTRVRKTGSDGGHNGLGSIIYQLNSNEFVRIRCGIRREAMPAKGGTIEFVLSPFDREERVAAKKMIGRAADAVVEFATSGIELTMNKFNTRL